MKKIILLAGFLFTGSANAILIDFENIAPNGSVTTENGAIPSLSQDGFTFSTSHGHIWDSAQPSWNGNGTDWMLNDSSSFTISRSDNALFSFDGLDAATWRGSLLGSVAINGFVGGNLLTTINLQITNIWTTFNMNNTFSAVDTITFISSNGGYDNLIINNNVPEPTSITLLGLGLAGLGFSRKKKAA
ncbi:MAG: PEP-CTERM sorting domain-containing protein [Methylococcaceae bacterium]|nr:PEP-CTERM sorting domain-containing protein [Methylococcaceae bacterium]